MVELPEYFILLQELRAASVVNPFDGPDEASKLMMRFEDLPEGPLSDGRRDNYILISYTKVLNFDHAVDIEYELALLLLLLAGLLGFDLGLFASKYVTHLIIIKFALDQLPTRLPIIALPTTPLSPSLIFNFSLYTSRRTITPYNPPMTRTGPILNSLPSYILSCSSCATS